jgi:tetratricopeptide (TPR) repeat protein
MQAALIEPHFTGPVFELGMLALDRKKYSEALRWFEQIPADDPDYLEARFKLGLSTYSMGDYGSAVNYFREIAKTVPLSEVFNNLGAAEYQLGQPSAMEDLHRALEGDANDSTYLFNAGVVALKQNNWDEATKRLHSLLENRPNDAEAKKLLAQTANRDPKPADPKSLPPLRLKNTFNMTAFRQLKAVLQPKGGTE